MPYRHAHWFLLAIVPLAALAFWPAYISRIATAPAEMHMHGVTASLWLALLVAQSMTIHANRTAAHRTLGAVSLGLFPLFLAGGATIFLGMAQRYADGASPFYTLYAPRLALIDLVSVAAFAWCYYCALRLRRTTQLHARYMLATVLFLLPPILGRLAPLLPPLAINGPADFWKLGIGFQLGNAATAALAFALALRSGRYNRPFFEAGTAVLLAALLYQFLGPLPAWQSVFAQFAAVPPLPFALLAGLAGAAIAYAGWTAGRRPRQPHGTASA